jgi:Na+-translocating ferredoxin:NAD+ oxidoreductase RNF subunit RnfB
VNIILISIIALGGVGIVAAVILYFVASKFKVFEDPKIDEVEEILPSANCGGCGFPGCRAFAEATAKKAKKEHNIDGLFCPVGGNDVMQKVGEALGLKIEAQEPMIAVVRCNGTFENSPGKVKYEGVSSCSFAHAMYTGEGGCQYGCLGLGDCVEACEFDAIHISDERGVPEVNNKCTACGACVEACPRDIIELRKKGPKEKRIFVSCVNKEKGAVAIKNCAVACIGCGKCEKVCNFDAITITSFLAYIDFNKCALCRKCVEVCPTNAIWEVNFKPRKPKADKITEKTKPARKDNSTDTKASTKSQEIKEKNKIENNSGESRD